MAYFESDDMLSGPEYGDMCVRCHEIIAPQFEGPGHPVICIWCVKVLREDEKEQYKDVAVQEIDEEALTTTTKHHGEFGSGHFKDISKKQVGELEDMAGSVYLYLFQHHLPFFYPNASDWEFGAAYHISRTIFEELALMAEGHEEVMKALAVFERFCADISTHFKGMGLNLQVNLRYQWDGDQFWQGAD